MITAISTSIVDGGRLERNTAQHLISAQLNPFISSLYPVPLDMKNLRLILAVPFLFILWLLLLITEIVMGEESA